MTNDEWLKPYFLWFLNLQGDDFMANTIILTLGKIQLTGVPITVTGRTDTTGELTKDMVKVKILSGDSFIDLTTFHLDDPLNTTATIVNGESGPGTFLETDLLLIQISDGTELSDRVSADLSQSLTATETYSYPYEMPSTAGQYNMDLLSVNDEEVNALSNEFTLLDETLATILTPVYKEYLTPVKGQMATITVNYNDTVTGTYQVVASAKLI